MLVWGSVGLLGLRVQGFRDWGLGITDLGIGFLVQGVGLGLGIRVEGVSCRTRGSYRNMRY